MTKQLFRIVLDVDADNLANLMIDYGDYMQSASKIEQAETPEPEVPRKARSRTVPEHLVGPYAKLRITEKAPSFGNSKAMRAAHAVAAKMCAGKPYVVRRDLSTKIAEEIVPQGYAKITATSCVSQLTKLGYLQELK